jgi:multiple sugar transport system permease protein
VLYALLLIGFGVIPSGYALYLAFTKANGSYAGLANFFSTARDFRFVTAFENVGVYLLVWLPSLVFATVGIALMLNGRAQRLSDTLRFLYYIPGAFVGAASVLVWLFMLDPTVSPIGWLLGLLGYHSFGTTILPQHLPVILTIMAFWTGAGGWILVMHGALNNIPRSTIEAAIIDGSNRLQVAWHVQVPLIKKWIAYMVILAFAGGTQLFVEPQLLGQASFGAINPSWSPNQLAYQYAFQQNDFNGAAAISIDLLMLGLVAAIVIVTRTGFFRTE